MASIIDDKLFELVTKSENFEFAYDISERFESIKEHLRIEFWKEFQKKLKTEHPDFVIEEINSLYFHFKNRRWSILTFYFSISEVDTMNYGIGSTNKRIKSKFPELIDDLQNKLFDFEIESEYDGYWFYASCSDNLKSLQGLKRILPDNRDKIIAEYYNIFKKLLDDIKETILRFEESIKKF